MDHAEAIERLADLALEPGLMAGLDEDPSAVSMALRAHVAACEPCALELAAWRRTWSALDGRGVDDPDLGGPRPSLRERTLLAVAADGRALPRGGGSRRGRMVPWLAVAAAVAMAVGAAGLGVLQGREADRVRSENAGLAATASALGEILTDPAHRVASLRAVDGSAEGTVAWTDDEIAVVASGLPALAPGRTYRCWVEYDGERTPVGPMALSGSTGYWVGSTDGYRRLIVPGGTFGVSIVSEDGEAIPVLVGST